MFAERKCFFSIRKEENFNKCGHSDVFVLYKGVLKGQNIDIPEEVTINIAKES